MKRLLILVFAFSTVFAYSQGKIYPVKNDAKKQFAYEPAKGVVVPEKAVVLIITDNDVKKVPLNNSGKGYTFAPALPDSIYGFIAGIIDAEGNVIDNNAGKGYTTVLKNKTAAETNKSELLLLGRYRYSAYYLKTGSTIKDIISLYDGIYKAAPALKNDLPLSYNDYLLLEYQDGKGANKAELLEFTQQLSKKGDEKSLLAAANNYKRLNMTTEYNQIYKNVLEKYPKGLAAKTEFWNAYRSSADKSEEGVLKKLNEYKTRFSGYKKEELNQFYMDMLYTLASAGDTTKLAKYENECTDKVMIASVYNNLAWNLSGQSIEGTPKDLKLALYLSAKSVDFIKAKLNKPAATDDVYDLQNSFAMTADTYALLLYKSGKVAEAFKYQDEIRNLVTMGDDGKERYAIYAEKVKGTDFARAYIEKELTSGATSSAMSEQLLNIYKTQNLPMADFDKVMAVSKKNKAEKNKEQIVKTFGTVTAPLFTLVDINGNTVSLADFKGKVVVLDFWATWCGPCRASLPHMQELVKKYKEKNVEFFFINTWERTEKDVTKKNVEKFVADNKYTLHVLFDYDSKVITDYKVDGIPASFVISKNGEILAMDHSYEGISSIIDDNL